MPPGITNFPVASMTRAPLSTSHYFYQAAENFPANITRLSQFAQNNHKQYQYQKKISTILTRKIVVFDRNIGKQTSFQKPQTQENKKNLYLPRRQNCYQQLIDKIFTSKIL
jgi:hypothetical protein